MSNHNYIYDTIKQQDDMLLSSIDKKYRPFAERLIDQYSAYHPLCKISREYKDDVNKLKEEIRNALSYRHSHILYLINEFRSIK